MFALAAHSILTVWEGLRSSTVRPMFYFLTVSHFTSDCQDLWGQQECMEISARCCYIQALSHSNIQLFFFSHKSSKLDKELTQLSLVPSLSLCDTLAGTFANRYRMGWCSIVSPEVRWHPSTSSVRCSCWRWVKWCPKPASTQELKLLTDSSLKHGPWSWSRCVREAEL